MEPYEVILDFLLSEGVNARMLDDQEDEEDGHIYIYIDDPSDEYLRCLANNMDECLIVTPSAVICRSCELNNTYQSVEIGLHHPKSLDYVLEMLKCSRDPNNCQMLKDKKVTLSSRIVSCGEQVKIYKA